MQDLLGSDGRDLEKLVRDLNMPVFRAKQIFHWVHGKGVTSIQEMSNIPKNSWSLLEQHSYICPTEVAAETKSHSEDTVKFLLKYADGVTVETVLMTYDREHSRDRNTVCVSTQAGCGMGCVFCATGISGMERNLTTGEIMAQVWAAQRYCAQHGFSKITNVVFMGMGEPLANLPAVVKSIFLLNEPEGLNIGMRRMTVSTCGLVPQMYRLADYKLPITLAVSLHAAGNALRSRLMPVNKSFSLEEVMKAADHYAEKTGRRITFEYALFQGINDSEKEAEKLGKLLKGRLAHVNIIPFNPVMESGLRRPDPAVVERFVQKLSNFGVSVSIREEKGLDIDAACGQLRKSRGHVDNVDVVDK